MVNIFSFQCLLNSLAKKSCKTVFIYLKNVPLRPESGWVFNLAEVFKGVMAMNSVSIKFRQILADRLEAKGLDPETIPSFIRSMRICFSDDPALNHLTASRQLQFLGWNDIEVDYHTLQIAIAFFEAEGVFYRPLAFISRSV